MIPPLWLRHLVSWRLLEFIDRHLDTCWAELAMWKLGYGVRSWWPVPLCHQGRNGEDYCGKYTNNLDAAVGRPTALIRADKEDLVW